MANHKSAKKRTRQTIVRNERNKAKKTVSRSIVKSIRESINKKDKKTAMELLPQAQSILGKIVKTGVLKKNNAARKISRLTKQAQELK